MPSPNLSTGDRPGLEADGSARLLRHPHRATAIGVALNFTEIDPVKALIWSAVINGVISVPIMAVMMLMAARPEIMGRFTVRRRLKNLGWLATGVMALAVVAMLLALLTARR